MKTRAQRRQEAVERLSIMNSSSTKKKNILEEREKAKVERAKGGGRKKVKKEEGQQKSLQKQSKQQSSKDTKRSNNKTQQRDEHKSISKKKSQKKESRQKSIKKSEKIEKKQSFKEVEIQERKKYRSRAEQRIEKAKKIQFKGKVPIDEHCRLSKNSKYHVLQYNGRVYSATLNQTNVANNNNKFYILQILQHSINPQTCYFFTRWGRVGFEGQSDMLGPFSISVSINFFLRKYSDKYKGGYIEVMLSYEDNDKQQLQKKEEKIEQKDKQDNSKSKLPSQVKRLIQLIFDINMMNKHMKEIGYNTKKMPLGKLSQQSIKKGFQILNQLQKQFKQKYQSKQKIQELTNKFYTQIPHDFGFSKMKNHILDDIKKVKQKIQLLQSLAQIKVATKFIQETEENQNKYDSNYKKLNRDIKFIPKNSEHFKLINNYLHTTHASTHGSYQLQIEDLFEINTQFQDVRYTKHIHNKMLLWHGSRLTNFVGILSQGLRIAPPQAPALGYMFGKGVYFADMSSKSANYCCTSRDNPTGILLLCEVALGDMNEKLHADIHAENLPPGKNSTKGIGRTAPDPKNEVKTKDGVIIPMGPGKPTGIPGAHLQYNEYIVYDKAQIRIKYLLRTRFNFKNSGWY